MKQEEQHETKVVTDQGVVKKQVKTTKIYRHITVMKPATTNIVMSQWTKWVKINEHKNRSINNNLITN